ncbi:fetuin-B-like [Pelodytes ibericus]
MKTVCAFIICVIVSLCNARSEPRPVRPAPPIPVDCNATDTEAGLALDLINEDRDEGFVLKPFRVVEAFRQESQKPRGGSIFYLTVDVLETKCSVLSGATWKNCSEQDSFHETVFGQCKAIVYISKIWRILKLINYNCTLAPVPSSAIVSICPDCPVVVREITPKLNAKTGKLVEKYNNENNNTHYFNLYHLERVRTQWVFGQSYFLAFTIKETNCLKTQSDVVLANCEFLENKKVGFCTGGTYNNPAREEVFHVSCEIYEPEEHAHHDHPGREGCPEETGEPQDGQDNVNRPTQEQKGSQIRSHKRGCRPHHHGHRPHHHDHRHGHHPHHHDHHHGHQPHHHDHHHGHHPHHHHHHCPQTNQCNHTSSERHGSSSEEDTQAKPNFQKFKGSVRITFLDDGEVLPAPSSDPGKSKHYIVPFPDSNSPLQTCPGKTKETLPQILKYFPHKK